MKKLLTGLALVVCAGLTGCNKNDVPGGPGAENPRSFGVLPAENTFELVPPRQETVIHQGETKTIALGIKRTKNFDQEVLLEFRNLPAGLKATPVTNPIAATDQEVQVKVEAAPDAALGKHAITATGAPVWEGAKGASTLKVVVEKPGSGEK